MTGGVVYPFLTATFFSLFWRALYRSVWTENTTITFFWFQKWRALSAFIEPLAIVCWHLFNLRMSTFLATEFWEQLHLSFIPIQSFRVCKLLIPKTLFLLRNIFVTTPKSLFTTTYQDTTFGMCGLYHRAGGIGKWIEILRTLDLKFLPE